VFDGRLQFARRSSLPLRRNVGDVPWSIAAAGLVAAALAAALCAVVRPAHTPAAIRRSARGDRHQVANATLREQQPTRQFVLHSTNKPSDASNLFVGHDRARGVWGGAWARGGAERRPEPQTESCCCCCRPWTATQRGQFEGPGSPEAARRTQEGSCPV